MHPAALPVAALLAQIEEVHARRSGPGGQHRNKVQTAVVLTHGPTGIAAEASERRSQNENRRVALHRLRLRLAIEHRTPTDAGPSPCWQSRVRGRRLVVAASHDDFPTLVAEALDRLHARGQALPAAAADLGVTPTQLANLFRKAPAAWAALNGLRARAGLPPLQ